MLLLLAAVSGLLFVNSLWGGLLFTGLVFGFVLSFLDTVYSLTADGQLLIRCGPFYRQSISIASIRKVRPTRNPLSSPALSLDRLEIRYDKWSTVLISPRERSAFLQQLLQLNPQIELDPKLAVSA